MLQLSSYYTHFSVALLPHFGLFATITTFKDYQNHFEFDSSLYLLLTVFVDGRHCLHAFELRQVSKLFWRWLDLNIFAVFFCVSAIDPLEILLADLALSDCTCYFLVAGLYFASLVELSFHPVLVLPFDYCPVGSAPLL